MPSYDNSCSWSVRFLLNSTCYPRRKLCKFLQEYRTNKTFHGFGQSSLPIFHNFVVMKKRQLLTRKETSRPETACRSRPRACEERRNGYSLRQLRPVYVDYDQRVEFGVPTYFMSDYDILILTRKPIRTLIIRCMTKLLTFFSTRTIFHMTPIYQLWNSGLQLCALKAHYFETEIKREELFCTIPGRI